jgi:hypothetical protein
MDEEGLLRQLAKVGSGPGGTTAGKADSGELYRLAGFFSAELRAASDRVKHQLAVLDDTVGLDSISIMTSPKVAESLVEACDVVKQQMPDGPAQLDIAAQKSVRAFHTDRRLPTLRSLSTNVTKSWWPSGPNPTARTGIGAAQDVWCKVSALARMHGCNAYAVSI